MSRGYFGVGIYCPMHTENVGTLFRSAFCFGASYVFTIGKKYHRQATDTVDCGKQIPLLNYDSSEEFLKMTPEGCRIVCVENWAGAKDLKNFVHFEQCVYLLGNEANGLPEKFKKFTSVQIPSKICFNVSVAGSIVMYDRISKGA